LGGKKLKEKSGYFTREKNRKKKESKSKHLLKNTNLRETIKNRADKNPVNFSAAQSEI